MLYDIRRTMLAALLLATAAPAAAQFFMMTREGLDGALAQYFTHADRSHDGRLDRGEGAAALGVASAVLDKRGEPELFEMGVGPDGRPRLTLNEKGPLGRDGRFDMIFDYADRDRDGALSLVEVQAVARERFDAVDRDRDGVLNKEEGEAARRQFGMLSRMMGGE